MKKQILLLFLIFMSFFVKAQISVIGYISPNGSSFATHIDSFGKGGYMCLHDTLSRNNIPQIRRSVGMLAYDSVENVIWQLVGGTANSNWTKLTLPSAGSVNSVFGRTGNVTAQKSDYTTFYPGWTDTTAGGVLLTPYQAGITYVPRSNTITINGSAQTLGSNPNFTISNGGDTLYKNPRGDSIKDRLNTVVDIDNHGENPWWYSNNLHNCFIAIPNFIYGIKPFNVTVGFDSRRYFVNIVQQQFYYQCIQHGIPINGVGYVGGNGWGNYGISTTGLGGSGSSGWRVKLMPTGQGSDSIGRGPEMVSYQTYGTSPASIVSQGAIDAPYTHFTNFSVGYWGKTGGGTFTVTCDGIVLDTINTSLTTGFSVSKTYTGLTDAKHNVTITQTVAGTAGCELIGYKGTRGINGVTCNRVAQVGMRVDYMLTQDSATFIKEMRWVGYDHISDLLGANEASAGMSIHTFDSLSRKFVGWIKAIDSTRLGDIAICGTDPKGGQYGGYPGGITAWNIDIQHIAFDDSIAFFNQSLITDTSITTAIARGENSGDFIHLSTQGGLQVTTAYMQGMGWLNYLGNFVPENPSGAITITMDSTPTSTFTLDKLGTSCVLPRSLGTGGAFNLIGRDNTVISLTPGAGNLTLGVEGTNAGLGAFQINNMRYFNFGSNFQVDGNQGAINMTAIGTSEINITNSNGFNGSYPVNLNYSGTTSGRDAAFLYAPNLGNSTDFGLRFSHSNGTALVKYDNFGIHEFFISTGNNQNSWGSSETAVFFHGDSTADFRKLRISGVTTNTTYTPTRVWTDSANNLVAVLISSLGITATGTAGGDLTGTYPNPSVANSSITSAKILDSTITNADISATAAISYAKLNLTGKIVIADHSATGTPSSTTFYRGDNTWSTPSNIPGGSAGGDLAGTYPSPTIAATSGAGADIVSAITASSSVIPVANIGTGTKSGATVYKGDGTFGPGVSGNWTVGGIIANQVAFMHAATITTSSTTLNTSAYVWYADCSSHNDTFNVPTSGINTFQMYSVMKTVGTNNLVIHPTSGTINGQSYFTISTLNDAYILNFDGANTFTWTVNKPQLHVFTPTIAAGTGAGTSPTGISVTGNDTWGTVTFTTGSSPSANSSIVTVTFAQSFTVAPLVTFNGTNAISQSVITGVYFTPSTTTLVLNCGSVALSSSTTYTFIYHTGQ